MNQNLADLVKAANNHKGSWEDVQLAQDVKDFLWSQYDADDDLVYPIIENWDDLLAEKIQTDTYNRLSKDETLSILFGLIHRNRIIEGLWWSMFERGVTQKLLGHLRVLEAGKCR
jgi:hypothetical protein